MKKTERPSITDYSEPFDDKGIPNRYRYSYDDAMWKKSQKMQLTDSDKFIIQEYTERVKNGGPNDLDIKVEKTLKSVRLQQESESWNSPFINRICDAIEFFAPFIAYGILKTGYNAVKKINKK